MLPTHMLPQGGPLPSVARARIQTEFRMHNLRRISPPTAGTGDQLLAPHALTEGPFHFKQLEEGDNHMVHGLM
jgi:hypothetical protein